MLLGLGVWVLRPARLADTIWSDIMLANQRLPADGRIVIVNITADDMLANGVDRLSRVYVARTLERLASAGVRRMAIDFNFGSRLRPEEEAALLAVTRRLGPTRLATGYEPDPLLRTEPALLRNTTLVDMRWIADADGRYRRLWSPDGSPACDPGLWLATGEQRQEQTLFDLRVDPATFAHVSLTELHDPAFNLRSLRDKRIVISLDKTLGKSRANLPVHGFVDRGTLLAMATQSRLDGYPERVRWSELLTLATNLVALAIGCLIGLRAPTVTRASLGFLLLGGGSLSVSLLCVLGLGMPSQPVTTMSIAMAGLSASLACRLGLADLVLGSLSGNMSPEEVWAWRTKAESARPVVLFDAVGGIKRANDLACAAFGLAAASRGGGTSPLAHRCMPGLGQRASQIAGDDGDGRVWDLEWPHGSLPLVVFHDVTSHVEQREVLQKRLVTDPLTGILNRVGFEAAVARIAQAGRTDYAIVFMDMNGFKEVNDVHGHDAGDALLKAAAARFSSVLRKQDVLARLGGDEFAILVEGSLGPESLARLATKLETALDAPIDLGLAVVSAGVAVGYAVPCGADETTADVLRHADAAMYARKAEMRANLMSVINFDGLAG